jgi:acetyl esterase/lipase
MYDSRRTVLAFLLVILGGCTMTSRNEPPDASPVASFAATHGPSHPVAVPPQANRQMQAVLDELAALGGEPIESLTPEEARRQPTPADAVKRVLQKQGRSTAPEAVAKVDNRTIAGPGGALPIRIYTPAGTGPMPVIVYIHGGGWVIADLDTYDASPRALANLAKAVVVSVEYRHAPEHRFPAAHDDVYAAYKWVVTNAAVVGGDPRRVAVVGESAGGNMAAVIGLRSRQEGFTVPVHQVLVYPVADDDRDTPSYNENANAKPLNAAMMGWFFGHTLRTPADGNSPWISLADRRGFAGQPPATIIAAEIDPLRSEGAAYAERLKAAGVPVDYALYPGVTHEFFGMGAVVDQAKAAQERAASGLRNAFARP